MVNGWTTLRCSWNGQGSGTRDRRVDSGFRLAGRDSLHSGLGRRPGAVDYVVKPFSPTELAARIRAALRRREVSEPTVDVSSVISESLVAS